jgi:IS1 family transposase/transposase-like protein
LWYSFKESSNGSVLILLSCKIKRKNGNSSDFIKGRRPMALEPVRCPICHGINVNKYGKTSDDKQRYICRDKECLGKTFLLEYSDLGRLKEIKEQIVEMSLNGSGIRDIARVLKISPSTVIEELKKKETQLKYVNERVLNQIEAAKIIIEIKEHIEGVECDEMWSYVGNKTQQRWLWYAIDHETGKILAYVLAERKDEAFLKLKELLEPFGINFYYTDNWGAYERHIEPKKHIIGKSNTQKIERKNLTLRTRIKRLVRKTICFSKTILLHDIVIGLFINRYEFLLI